MLFIQMTAKKCNYKNYTVRAQTLCCSLNLLVRTLPLPIPLWFLKHSKIIKCSCFARHRDFFIMPSDKSKRFYENTEHCFSKNVTSVSHKHSEITVLNRCGVLKEYSLLSNFNFSLLFSVNHVNKLQSLTRNMLVDLTFSRCMWRPFFKCLLYKVE